MTIHLVIGRGEPVMPIVLLTQYLLGYIDPGSGSLIFQVVIGGIAGALVTLKLYWRRIHAYFKRDSPEENDVDGPK